MAYQNSLDGRVAIVAGSGGPSLGRATARLFAARGASVCVADCDRAGGEETVALIAREGGTAFFAHTDVSDEASVATTVAETVERLGGVHHLCNFANEYGPRLGVLEADAAHFDRIVGVNLRGSWLVVKHAMRAMLDNAAPERRDTRGAIVLVASTLAHRGAGDYAAYTAAKTGVLGLLRAAAIDGGRHKIRVNCVSPGVTRSPKVPMPTLEEELSLAEHGLLPYVGEPEDMASAAVWLCSDEARFVTGAALPVDGGWTAKL